jgi:hypothetical protein
MRAYSNVPGRASGESRAGDDERKERPRTGTTNARRTSCYGKAGGKLQVEQLIVVEPVSSHLPAAVVESPAKAKVPELKPVADALLVGNTSGRWRPLTVVWLRSLAKFSHGKDYRHY